MPLFEQGFAQHQLGRLRAAIEIYKELLRQCPDHAEALHYLGLAHLQLGQLAEADTYFTNSLRHAPESANTLCDYGSLKSAQKNFPEAQSYFRRALALNPNHPDALNNLGNLLNRLNRFDEALPLFKRLTLVRPEVAAGFRLLGDTYYKLDCMDSAIDNYRRAIELDSGDRRARLALGDAYESAGKFKQARIQYASILNRNSNSPLALARMLLLHDGEVEPEWLKRAHTLAASTETPVDARIRVNIALGQYHDRHENYEQAFEHFRIGNDLQFAKEPFNSERFAEAVDALIDVFTPEYFSSLTPRECSQSEQPVFVVGMPRSGTTLTEQILASHSKVAAGGELSSILTLVTRIEGLSPSKSPYPYGMRGLGASQCNELAARYLERLRKVSVDALRVTDKLPFNFMHLGLIASIFPKARIIQLNRNPMDNCLSCYFTSFSEQIRFASHLETLGRYYLDYRRLISHWKKVLPIEILSVNYESIISSTDQETRKMLDYCGLEWEDSCRAFHRTHRDIKTPSRWQVRQPIYSTAVGRWKHYNRQLLTLQNILGLVLVDEQHAWSQSRTI